MTHPLTPREKGELKSCPFCGGGASMHDGMGEFWVRCDDCGSSGAMRSRQDRAERDWNDRRTALASGSDDHAPAAWRVKDFADGWIVCGSEQTAADLAAAMRGATVQPLYGPALLVEIAALRAMVENAADGSMGQTDKLLAMHERATEAERKLAEADGLLIELADAPQPKDTGGRFFRAMSSISAYVARLNARKLSKEAERG